MEPIAVRLVTDAAGKITPVPPSSLAGAFAPLGAGVLVTNALAVQVPGSSGTYRIRNLATVAQLFAYGGAGIVAPAAIGAGVVGMIGGSVEVFTFSSTSYFIAGTSVGFEIIPGTGN